MTNNINYFDDWGWFVETEMIRKIPRSKKIKNRVYASPLPEIKENEIEVPGDDWNVLCPNLSISNIVKWVISMNWIFNLANFSSGAPYKFNYLSS
tara:strand:+ start:7438 stop:7722 length:285 start_codon:yes stop_codon:yes gene_type:complete